MRVLFVAAVCALFLGACGIKGNLFLPPSPDASAKKTKTKPPEPVVTEPTTTEPTEQE